MHWKTFPTIVTERRMETPSVLHMAFRRADDELLDYKPGQFVNVHFEYKGEATHRSYSIANPPGSEGIEIAISPVEGGRATEYLFGLAVGDEVSISGPYGRFVLRDDPPCRLILVGTGTGVTPYRAMLPSLADLLADPACSVELLLGVRTPDDLLYADDFTRFAADHPDFGFRPCFSRVPQADLDQQSWAGYVQTQLGRLGPDPDADIVYLCGNPNMVDAAFADLKERGFGMPRVRREKYVSAKN